MNEGEFVVERGEVVVDLEGKSMFNQESEKVVVEQGEKKSSLDKKVVALCPIQFPICPSCQTRYRLSSDLPDSSGATVLHNSGACNGCITKGFCFYKLSPS